MAARKVSKQKIPDFNFTYRSRESYEFKSGYAAMQRSQKAINGIGIVFNMDEKTK
jgi:hypothetical protein